MSDMENKFQHLSPAPWIPYNEIPLYIMVISGLLYWLAVKVHKII